LKKKLVNIKKADKSIFGQDDSFGSILMRAIVTMNTSKNKAENQMYTSGSVLKPKYTMQNRMSPRFI
jgi:hypothetical protein